MAPALLFCRSPPPSLPTHPHAHPHPHPHPHPQSKPHLHLLQTPSLSQDVTKLCNDNNISQALHLLSPPNPSPHSDTVSILLSSIGQNQDIEAGRRLHALISSSDRLMSDPVVTTRLLTMYSLCSSPSDSRALFDSLHDRNLYHWNAMISGYSRNELWAEAVALLELLLTSTDHRPDNFTLPCVLKSCGGLSDARLGGAVHGMGAKLGLSCDSYVANSLVSMYGKCGLVREAARVFETMPKRNLVSWNCLVSGFCESGLILEGFQLLVRMMMESAAAAEGEGMMTPDDATLVILLPRCASEGWVEMGRTLHGLSVKLGLDHELRVSNALIDMYSKCGCLVEAWRLFAKSNQRNEVSWNAMIGGYARNGDVVETFDLLREMLTKEGMRANEVTVLNVLPACLGPWELDKVKELQGYVVRNVMESNELVSNALVAAYAKCGSLEFAEKVFNNLELQTVSSWNALIGGCAQNGDSSKAIDLFLEMMSLGLEPDWFSIGSLLLACTHLKYLRYGRSIHGFIQRNGLEKDSFITISLLSLYMQCGDELKARVLFDAMEERDVISWNAIISGYSQNGFPHESLRLYRKMQEDGYWRSIIATTSALMACAHLSALRLGKELHCFALKASFAEDTFTGSSIIDMYAKCGAIEQANTFFGKLHIIDIVSWNVMIMGYGIHGNAAKAIDLFNRMQKHTQPDAFTYTGILTACSHAGLVKKGLDFFEDMKNSEVELKLEHYACVADMLGRAGRLSDAMSLIEDMPEEPDGRIWSALLGACRVHGDISLGERIAYKLLELEPDKAEHYILASNLFAVAGRWDDVRSVRKKLKENGLQKDPGCSWIELGGIVYNFMVGDNCHQESDEIRKDWLVLEGFAR
ncbi:pentatricopeptide repeat-containing protein-like [Iris pallida]|uniref:Pentatricopeptide repeat-containing protein-like n=1 Tax=Iris pallida TaxID=29817 RepID=A0AAX6EUW5_IRIPA|nr:pentatricopeptide repeat-containing protein-like [Iris pallida]